MVKNVIRNPILYILVLYFPLYLGCNKKETVKQDTSNRSRIISFSGYDWIVRSSGESKGGPGPNYFSDSKENVSVDDQGKLHLRITHRNGKWYCAGITLLKSPGYGYYVFQTGSRVDTLDKNSVAGLFLYRNDTKEIDIEFSKWGIDQNMNAQYAVQPGNSVGNKLRFNLHQEDAELTNIINWQQGFIKFYSYEGALADTGSGNNLIQQWIYRGSDNPSDKDDLATKINFWLFKGNATSNHADMEIIISSFEYF